ncbi:MAG: ComF family protein [Firmicutes bacterium]|nr:ComF family protein [Bacillota bacterium]
MHCSEELFDKGKYGLCEYCYGFLNFIKADECCVLCGTTITTLAEFCIRCKQQTPQDKAVYTRARSVFAYEGLTQALIYHFKYDNNRFLAEYFAQFLVDKYLGLLLDNSKPKANSKGNSETTQNAVNTKTSASPKKKPQQQPNWHIDIVVPVPSSRETLRDRGFNQSALLANQFVKCLQMKGSKSTNPLINAKQNIIANENILLKVLDTPRQTIVDRQTRLKNLNKSIAINGNYICKTTNALINSKQQIKDKSILIIDDVYTTGATVNECAKVLLKAGASKVYALTLANTIYKINVPNKIHNYSNMILN